MLKKAVYPSDMDKECIELCDSLNSLPSIETSESCCGHLKQPFSIFFHCRDVYELSVLGRATSHNYSDGKWEIMVDSSDTHPFGLFWLRSKEPFKSYEEMKKSSHEMAENIQFWLDKGLVGHDDIEDWEFWRDEELKTADRMYTLTEIINRISSQEKPSKDLLELRKDLEEWHKMEQKELKKLQKKRRA